MKQIIDIDESKAAEAEYGFSASKMVEDETIVEETTPKKKRGPGRPSQQQYGLVPANTYTEIVTEEAGKKKAVSFEKQVEKKYGPQVAMIAGIIAQSDQMLGEISEELDKYREKPSYGGRSRNLVMSNLQSTRIGALNTKLSAVRELVMMRNKINDLAMQNRKMEMAAGMDDQNSDKAVMDAYYAIVNASRYGLPPVNQPLHPSSINTGVNLQGTPIATSTIGSPAPIVTADGVSAPITEVQTFMPQNLTPIQQRMILEKNPNIKTVVVYNQSTGSKRFDIIDVSTGMSIPGVQRPAPFLLDDMKPDLRNGIASNSNANMSFPLVIEGTRAVDEL